MWFISTFFISYCLERFLIYKFNNSYFRHWFRFNLLAYFNRRSFYQNSPFKLSSQSDIVLIALNITDLKVSSNTLEFNNWNMFIFRFLKMNTTLKITYDPAPYFIEDLPPGLTILILTQSNVQLSDFLIYEDDIFILNFNFFSSRSY